jgi:hypothetical protein
MTAEASDSTAPNVDAPSESPSGLHPVTAAPAQNRNDGTTGAGARELPVGYLAHELKGAELLLSYASETGLIVDDATVNAVLKARSGHDSAMSTETAAAVLSALRKLAAIAKPVTAESLRACAHPKEAKVIIRNYTLVALVLGVLVLVFSIWSFVGSSISSSIQKDTATANDLALRLVGEVQLIRTGGSGTPTNVSQADMLKELQQFTVLIRSLNAHARQLVRLSPPVLGLRGSAPQEGFDVSLELAVPLLDLKAESDEAETKVKLYQRVRFKAATAQEAAAIWNGAGTTCLLPFLYAVLGACAYLLRLYEEQRRTRTFIQDGHRARFFIAGIGGLVVGLFDKFNLSQGESLSPLAVAFLVGYAVDVFFSFLEGLLRAFGRTGDTPSKEAKG